MTAKQAAQVQTARALPANIRGFPYINVAVGSIHQSMDAGNEPDGQ